MSKRLLGTVGTDWVSNPATQPAKGARLERCCNRCEPRQPSEKCATQYKCSRPPCNGTRKAGDFGYTWCERKGRHFTLCGRCYKEVEPAWHLSTSTRRDLFKQSVHFKDVLILNEIAGEEEIATAADESSCKNISFASV